MTFAEAMSFGPVLAPYDAIGHPYFESRGAVREVNDPLLGNVHIRRPT